MFILASTLGCFLAFFLIPIEAHTDARMVILVFAVAAGFLFGLITIIGSIFSHIENLGRVRLGNERIAAAQVRTKQLKDSIKEVLGDKILNDDILALANKDNPISEAINSLDISIRNEEGEQDRLINAKADIVARKAGPLSFVVSLYGEE